MFGDTQLEETSLKRRQFSNSAVPLNVMSENEIDDLFHHPDDDKYKFFAQGRDFESAYVNHKYTAKERQALSLYDSLDYLPPHSQVYKNWILRQPARLEWDRWIMMGMIGFTIGMVGFLLHQLIDVIVSFKWDKATEFLQDANYVKAWGWVLGYSCVLVFFSSVAVVFWRPSAAGSGIPELIGFLNGTIVRHVFNLKTMLVKFFSCCFAVASGLPVGPEGPMIHLGGLIGAGLSQFRSETLNLHLPFFSRFRNSEDRRNFISAGAAAGVSSAFGAPVGGLLFAMEEVSSFWNMKLSWQTFFCCMVSTVTTDLFNSAFSGFRYMGSFGLFKSEKYILFQVTDGLAVNILAFLPTVVIGVIGGILGAGFTFSVLKLARIRRKLLSLISSPHMQKMCKLIEPILAMVVMASASVMLPAAFPCSNFVCYFKGDYFSQECLNNTNYPVHTEDTILNYTCPVGTTVVKNGTEFTNGTYSEVATLLFGTGEAGIQHLYSRNTHLQFGYVSLVSVLVVYFLLACWVSGTAISCGLVVPMLFIGGLYGRIVGLSLVSMFGIHTVNDSPYWSWMDPGAFALIGGASFFGGVSRLTMSLTVIMIEITNDVQFLLPIMVAIMVAKWVGDFLTHPLYHALLEFKCIPFLDAEPVIVQEGGKVMNLELYCARDVMSAPAVVFFKKEKVHNLASLLLYTQHGGFPVVDVDAHDRQVFLGLITRKDILLLLSQESLFEDESGADQEQTDVTFLDYQDFVKYKLVDTHSLTDVLQRFTEDEKYENLFVNLVPYMNQSAMSVHENFSLHRAYIIFRTLGLRHLVVVDNSNSVKGVITRKDLMGFNIEEKLYTASNVEQNKASSSQEMIFPTS